MATDPSNGAWDELEVALRGGTLESLVALRMLLKSGLGTSRPGALRAAVEQSVDQLEQEIDGLRALIAEMRSAQIAP